MAASKDSLGEKPRLSRRAALRAGAALGAGGLAWRSARPTAGVAWLAPRRSPPRPGGWNSSSWPAARTRLCRSSAPAAGLRSGVTLYYNDAPIFAEDAIGGTPIGTYVCFGAWTHASTETGEAHLRLTRIQWRLADGTITGLGNEGGTDPANGVAGNSHHVGTV